MIVLLGVIYQYSNPTSTDIRLHCPPSVKQMIKNLMGGLLLCLFFHFERGRILVSLCQNKATDAKPKILALFNKQDVDVCLFSVVIFYGVHI